MRLAAAFLTGLVLANLVDWLFGGVLFHHRYQAHPEVWRVNGPNPRALMIAQAMIVPTVAGMIGLLALTGNPPLPEAVLIAVLLWAIAAAPATITNGAFIKIDPAVVASHAAGWLLKLVLIAVSSTVLRVGLR